MSKERTFVGFGFGAIQAGLFLYEAHRTERFSRLVVAEVNAEVIDAVRAAGNCFTVNIAHANGIEPVLVGPIEIYNPNDAADRAALIEAIAVASELATALPSVDFYTGDSPGSVHRLLAEGLARNPNPAVVYTAENNNHAAEILEAQVLAAAASPLPNVQFLNTVIGKMSGIVPMDDAAHARGIQPLTPSAPRAFLVEAFNRILVSQVRFNATDFQRAIRVFEEKPDLLPFEEAKLYGHNAIHAMGGYLGLQRGLNTFDQLAAHPDLMAQLRAAFIEECGAALIKKHHGVDPLFTPEGFTAYADDLLERMVNPHLEDALERVTRDTPRKLGWNDRLIGTMRLVLSQGIPPTRLAKGAAAALQQAQVPLAELLSPEVQGTAEFAAINRLLNPL